MRKILDEEKLSKLNEIIIKEPEFHHSNQCDVVSLLDERIEDINLWLSQNISYEGEFCGTILGIGEYSQCKTISVNLTILNKIIKNLEIAMKRLEILQSKPVKVIREK